MRRIEAPRPPPPPTGRGDELSSKRYAVELRKLSSEREREDVRKIQGEEFVGELVELLEQGKPVRRKLPGRGQIQIDRKLPFLFVYRQPLGNEDAGTERLIRAEASFLIAPGEASHREWVSALTREIVTCLSRDFGAFFLVEISALVEEEHDEFNAGWRPYFRVEIPKRSPPPETSESLEAHLRKVRIFQKRAHVDVVQVGKIAPHGMPPLLSVHDAKATNCSLLGVGILPVYRDAESGVFPLAVRSLRRQLSQALRRCVHRFCVSETKRAPASYLALGRRGLVKAVVDVDRRLAEISDSFEFLLHVTPVNVDAAWKEFQRSRYEKSPSFVYRPLPVDPILLKRKLFGIPMERIADPALEQLFRDKQLELDRKLTMFLDRGTNRFLYGSQQLYGAIPDELVTLAQEILARIPPDRTSESQSKKIDAEEFSRLARAELEHYREIDPEFSSSVEIRDDVFSVMVSSGQLLLGRNSSVASSRVNAVLQHEVGTHVVTYFNGRCQPLRILYNGLAGYDELQEGLAVLAEYLVGELTPNRLRILAARVVAATSLVSGASFVDTYRTLCEKHRFKRQRAFNICMRVYRGGGLTKDAVYLRGLVGILEYLRNDQPLDDLLIGKIAGPYLSVVHELRTRGVLSAPRLRPRHLEAPETHERLAKVRSGASALDLLEQVKGRKS